MGRKQEIEGFGRMTLLCLVMMFVVSPAVYAQQGKASNTEGTASSDEWQFEITPYAFAAGLDGTVGVRKVKADVDADTSDILDAMDIAGMLALEARKGKWVFLFDSVFMKLEGEGARSWSGPAGIGSLTGKLEATTKLQVYQPTLGYCVMDGPTRVDVLGGVRYTQLDVDLDLVVTTGPLLPGGRWKVSETEGWWDPIVGARVLTPLSEKWSFIGYADLGGFGVGSDFTYQVMAGAKWQINETVSMKLAYRYFYQDCSRHDLDWDMAAYGPAIGLGFSF